MKQINVLLVEDSFYSADLNVRELRKAGFFVQHQVVSSRRAMQMALKDMQWDIIISDNNMPGFDAIQAIEVRNQSAGMVPFAVVSEGVCDEDARRLVEKGCCTYLLKENLDMLGKLVCEILRAENAEPERPIVSPLPLEGGT